MAAAEISDLSTRIRNNVFALKILYWIAAALLIVIFIAHIGSALYVLHSEHNATFQRVALFSAVSLSTIAVEIILIRAAFMLAARVGQLNDTVHAIDLANGPVNIDRLVAASGAVTMLRRSEATLKVIDVEQVVQTVLASARK